jgi:hypothetical protein
MPADGTLTARSPERKYRHIPFLGQVKRSYIICLQIGRGKPPSCDVFQLMGSTSTVRVEVAVKAALIP